MDKNNKIQSFFSEQLRELKDTHRNKKGGRVYVQPNKEKALNRCLELADFGVCLEDIHTDMIVCNCDTERFGYVCVNPSNKFFFVVSVCNCEES
jgi:hypothetical protein